MSWFASAASTVVGVTLIRALDLECIVSHCATSLRRSFSPKGVSAATTAATVSRARTV